MFKKIVFIFIFFYTHILFAQTYHEDGRTIQFIENGNQWEHSILFKANLAMGSLYLEPDGFTFDFGNAQEMANIVAIKENSLLFDVEDLLLNRFAYKVQFEGANLSPKITKNVKSKNYFNYFIGSDPEKYAQHVFEYGEVIYHNLYKGISLKVYSDSANLKYDLIVAPNQDANQIQLKYKGVDTLYLLDEQLHIKAGFVSIQELKPIAYQIINGQKIEVSCAYYLANNNVSFVFPNGYNHNYELVIDPELIFASYTGSTEDNWGYTATFDLGGNLYGGGIVFGNGYPTTIGAYQTSFAGGSGSYGCDIGISKFNSDGTSLLYSTYIGGDANELPHSLVVDTDGNLIIYGTTGSSDYPATSGVYDASFNGGSSVDVDGVISFSSGVDIIVTKLNADGSDLLASTFIGGNGNDGFNLASSTQYNYGDFARGEIFTDPSNSVYVASSTYSSNFPTTSGAFQTTYAEGQDGCVFKLSSDLSSLLWSTYLGGSSADGAYSVKLNSSGHVIVGGGTASSDFPVSIDAWMDTYQGGSADGWVVKLNSTGTSLLAGSFIGTNQYDQVYFVETDENDFIYVTGQTKGTYPVTSDVYSNTSGKQFITKLNTAITSPDYSTIFGSGSSSINISPSAFLVDECENVYVSGWGGSVNQGYNSATGTTSGMPITSDAIDATTDGSDFYFIVLEKNAIALLYGSYFGGGSSAEHVDGGTSRFDKSGTIYQAVCAGCGGLNDFPTTDGSYSEINGSFNCNLGVGKIEFNLTGVYAESDADPSISGCAPFTVVFENTSSDAEQYIWTFGEGSASSTEFEPTYIYTTPGTYTVALVVIDSQTCNIADTSYLTITVFNDSIDALFTFTEVQNCDSLTAVFLDESAVFATTTYIWNFGDGSTSTEINPTHIFSEAGEYIVQLIITDPTSCNYADTQTVTINYLFNFNDGFLTSLDGCAPVTAQFSSSFFEADYYNWDFGNGDTDTGQIVNYLFTEPGDYTITLTLAFCSIVDSYTATVTVLGYPTAYFSEDPTIGLLNAPTLFVNLSTNATSYLWQFADGSTSTDVNAVHVFETLGNQNVCLTAYNELECFAIYCRDILLELEGVADIPTGFSPNADGMNDILFVEGFGFDQMKLQIYNRWGEVIFISTNQANGWDGNYKNTLQDIEVYAYQLWVKFTNGKEFQKSGNITLVR